MHTLGMMSLMQYQPGLPSALQCRHGLHGDVCLPACLSAVLCADALQCRQLMEQYGFCVPGNPYNRVRFREQEQRLGWMSHTAVKNAAQLIHQPILAVAGGNAGTGHVDAAVASILAAAGWRNLRQYKQVTPGSTAKCAEQLLVDVQVQLNGFPTTIREDQLLLQQLQQQLSNKRLSSISQPAEQVRFKAAAHNTARHLAAVRYRMDQKQLLETTAGILRALARTWF